MSRLLQRLADAFPLWVSAGGVLALLHPPLFTWFRGPAIVWGLGLIMLGMGLTLSWEDFRRVGRTPRPVALGFLAQYLIMPGLGWTLAQLLALPAPFAVGLILVSCCPGGTASNVVAYLARANVALSVLMTMASTFAAVVMTPLLTRWLVGERVPVDGWQLFLSTCQVVLLPLGLGLLLHARAPRLVKAVLPAGPLLSVLVITLIVGSVIAQNAEAVRASGPRLLLAVLLLHGLGFAAGHGLARLLGHGPQISRTVAIEVGMQNSGLGVVLARRHFADPLTAVPSAISSICHSVIGSVLAAWWRRRPAPDPQAETGAAGPGPEGELTPSRRN